MKWESELKCALDAIKAANQIICDNYMTDAQVQNNYGRDIKTLADIDAEGEILKILRVSGYPIIAEESENFEIPKDTAYWIVDPLDGTLNFTRKFKFAAVSIALWQNNEPILGVVQNIFDGDLWVGVVGVGATLNGNTISVSTLDKKYEAVLVTGFPSNRNFGKKSLDEFVLSIQEYKKIRMLGSAALMLAYVAGGQFEVYIEEDIYIWDVAAGLAIIRAAGGDFNMSSGTTLFQKNVKAHNGNFK
jgi:myo-inositol-1(or 4)-monophosphatase